MRKLGIFVEGQTEMLFTQHLIQQIAGSKGINFVLESWHAKSFRVITSENDPLKQMLILIVDCQSDNAVKSAILERRNNLISSGYEKVVGLRDLHPIATSELPRVLTDLPKFVPTKGLEIAFVVAVREVEAWFAQEGRHYNKIDDGLDEEVVRVRKGFDVYSDSAENIAIPAAFLNEVYQLVGKAYNKRKENALRTIRALDFENLYCDSVKRLPSLVQFIQHIESFIFFDSSQTSELVT